MPHKFKIGDIVKYRPTHRDRRTPTSECTVIALLPETDGKFELCLETVADCIELLTPLEPGCCFVERTKKNPASEATRAG